MAAASSSVPFFGIRDDEQYHNLQQQPPQPFSTPPTNTSSAAPPAIAAPQKKRRNLPGNPNPDAEVIALSPKTLMATNRFICEVCNKGFQREQNLQLHRRGHNLPWKLKQKNPKEVRRKVYLCPEPTCVHHDPSRALGDLTGIKKHYCRKHGEKKWKCDKCSKRYAVQSDWKAHSKTCGTREYRCDCGTLFSRRDSFITHRAFCDALAQESARLPNGIGTMGSHLYGNGAINLGLPPVNSQLSSLQDQSHTSSDLLRLGGAGGATQFDRLNGASFRQPQLPQSAPFYIGGGSNQEFNEDPQVFQSKPFRGLMQLQDLQSNTNGSSSTSAASAANLFNLSFFSNSGNSNTMISSSNNPGNQNEHLLVSDQFHDPSGSITEPTTLFAGNLMSNHMSTNMSSLYNPSTHNESVVPQMSATALLQKAAQMGATSSGGSGSSLLRGFSSSFSTGKHSNFQTSFSDAGTQDSSRAHVDNESHFQDLMNSLANGNGGIFAGDNEHETGFIGGFNRGLCNIDEGKLSRNLSTGGGAGIGGGSDRLTRDFLGVGSMMRGMGGGGMSHREQHLGIDIGSFDSDMKSGSSGRSFGGGSLQ